MSDIVLAFVFLSLSLLLVVLEFFIVSGGLVALAAIASAIFAIWYAFAAGAAIGWGFVIATPILMLIVIRWGLGRLQKSRMVTQAEITEEAGYHHAADKAGAAIGATGTLVTDAYLTGRARFAKGEIDVQVRGPGLAKGARIVVQAIEGPIVFVIASPENKEPT